MVADVDARNSGTDGLHDAGALVPEHRGAPSRRGAVDRILIGVAHAARMQADTDLARAGLGQLELRHRHRPARALEHGRADPHAVATSPGTS